MLPVQVEASSAFRGVGLVKLMGRSSGFIAMQASMASGKPQCSSPLSELLAESKSRSFRCCITMLWQSKALHRSAGIPLQESTPAQLERPSPLLLEDGVKALCRAYTVG